MAYKFQRGVARLSGSIVAEEGLNSNAAGLASAGAIAGATTVAASGLASLDGGINVDDNFTVSAAGAVVAVGVNAGGAITGATTIAASSNATIEGVVSGAAGTFDALAGTSLALQTGGITAAGAIAGATTISGSGVISGLSLDVEKGADLNAGGITNAGAIAGATTISGSGNITSGGSFLGQGIGLANASGLFDSASGLTQSGGELTVSLNEFTAADVDVSADSIAIVDANAGNATRKESIADLATAMAGDGLVASGGAFAVQVDDSTIETDSDTLRVKNGGVTNAKLANSSLTIGSTAVSLGATQTTFAGITQLTASNILVTNLDVVTINSVTQTESTLEVADKKIVAGLSGSSANQFGGGANDNGLASMKYFDAGGGTVGLKFAIGNNDHLVLRNNLFIPETNNVMALGSDSNRFASVNTTAIALAGTTVTSTAAELNILDGVNTTLAAAEINLLDNSTAIGAAVGDLADADGIIVEDGDTMKKVQLQSIKTYIGNGTAAVASGSAGATLSKGINYFGNIGAAVAVTLPGATTPSVGDSVMIKAGADCSGTNRLTINAYADHKIDTESSIALESPFAAVECVYVVSGSWRVF